MKLASLKEGQFVETGGYYTKGDAGQAKYLIVAAQAADGYGDHTLANGTVAVLQSGDVANVRQFGAKGDGITDDTLAVQAAIDSLATAGGTVLCPNGTYAISRTVGTNDHWGLTISNDNTSLVGESAKLIRFNSDISTYALAYPLIFIGSVDDNDVNNVTTNTSIKGFHFEGNDTRGTVDGASLSDFRTAINIRNSNGVLITENKFTKIDSHAIFCTHPVEYDYVNAVYYNSTKVYNVKITNNSFIAEPHAIAQRGRLYCIHASGVDHMIVDSNYFEWTDDAVFGLGTYSSFSQTENSLFTPSETPWSVGGDVMRGGRDWTVSNNVMLNNSEHAVYMECMQGVISGNNIYSENNTITTERAITLRGFGLSVTGNTIANYGLGIGISRLGAENTITGNSIQCSGASSTGIVIDSQNISSIIDDRAWFDVLPNKYLPIANVVISGNSISFQPFTVTGDDDVGIRISSGSADANYPDGQIKGVSITGNSFYNYYKGVLVTETQYSNCVITGNTFIAKPFTSAGFSASTVMNTYAVLAQPDNNARMLGLSFYNNSVNGCEYLYATATGTGSAASTPRGFAGNNLQYIKNIGSADVALPSSETNFNNNNGSNFLDRDYGQFSIQNALSDASGSSTTARLQCFRYVSGSSVRFQIDDTGGVRTF